MGSLYRSDGGSVNTKFIGAVQFQPGVGFWQVMRGNGAATLSKRIR